MDLAIKGRRAIIAGGSAGLGRATATCLAKEGVEVLISARNAERLERAAREIGEEANTVVRFICADHSTVSGRNKLLAALPDPDILVTTISPPPGTPDILRISPEEWISAFESGAVGPMELMRQVVDGMVERGWGRIANITTLAAKYPKEARMLSGAPRSALANYTSVLARKVARHNVVVNNMLPGIYMTEGFFAGSGAAGDRSTVQEQRFQIETASKWRIPAKRLGKPEEFGMIAAIFCAEFAGFMVGQNVVLDGGAGSSLF
jgi:3-oxoacyl-[acyl-carrier protein] reductase